MDATPLRTDLLPVGKRPMLSIDVRSKAFARHRERRVLGCVAMEVAEGEIVVILGPSGTGKTTLLRMMAGLDVDYDGEIVCRGERVTGPSSERNLVFQDARLLAWRTVRGNVAFGLPRTVRRSERRERVDMMLRLVRLQDKQDAWPRELSGGMEKRAALARALVGSPRLLMLDEPFSAVDMSGRFALQEELVGLHRRLALTTVVVTHDIDEAVYLADRVVVLGGSPSEIQAQIRIALDRPRDRTSPEFEAARLRVLAWVLDCKHHPRRGLTGQGTEPWATTGEIK